MRTVEGSSSSFETCRYTGNPNRSGKLFARARPRQSGPKQSREIKNHTRDKDELVTRQSSIQTKIHKREVIMSTCAPTHQDGADNHSSWKHTSTVKRSEMRGNRKLN